MPTPQGLLWITDKGSTLYMSLIEKGYDVNFIDPKYASKTDVDRWATLRLLKYAEDEPIIGDLDYWIGRERLDKIKPLNYWKTLLGSLVKGQHLLIIAPGMTEAQKEEALESGIPTRTETFAWIGHQGRYKGKLKFSDPEKWEEERERIEAAKKVRPIQALYKPELFTRPIDTRRSTEQHRENVRHDAKEHLRRLLDPYKGPLRYDISEGVAASRERSKARRRKETGHKEPAREPELEEFNIRKKVGCIVYTDESPDEPIFNFGKYKGKRIRDVYRSHWRGADYLWWLLRGGPKGIAPVDESWKHPQRARIHYRFGPTYEEHQPCLADSMVLSAVRRIVEEEDPAISDDPSLDPIFIENIPYRKHITRKLQDFWESEDK